MSSNDTQKPPVEDTQSKISDYLQAPRKKRKNYVIMALSKDFPRETQDKIDGFIKQNFDGLSVSYPKSGQELAKQFGRNISLLIVDHNFENEDEIFRLIEKLKIKRAKDNIPILFFTNQPTKLVSKYNERLLVYQESDEYIILGNSSIQKIFARIRDGIENKNRRRGRRYEIDRDISFFHLNSDKNINGKIVDLSAQGAQIKAEDGCLFKENDQLRLNIPTRGILEIEGGDFLKISARVRRVFIGGNHAAVSFEHMSDTQSNKIVKFLSTLVSKHLSKQVRIIKNKAIAAAQNN